MASASGRQLMACMPENFKCASASSLSTSESFEALEWPQKPPVRRSVASNREKGTETKDCC
eukprot:scaffold4971_cov254-Pinguiococcus_pyrenoidosus.AAC.7